MIFIFLLFFNNPISFTNKESLVEKKEALVARDFMPDRVMLKIIGSEDGGIRVEMFDVITTNKIQVRKIYNNNTFKNDIFKNNIFENNKSYNQLHIYEIGQEINLKYLNFFDVELFAESFLNEKEDMNFTLLKNPIKEGNSWISDDIVFKITSTNTKVKTPAGTFNTIEVTTEKKGQDKVKTYYAKGLGVVKVVSNGTADELVEIDYNIKKFKSINDVIEYLNKITTGD